jgi:hypothetical protein
MEYKSCIITGSEMKLAVPVLLHILKSYRSRAVTARLLN